MLVFLFIYVLLVFAFSKFLFVSYCINFFLLPHQMVMDDSHITLNTIQEREGRKKEEREREALLHEAFPSIKITNERKKRSKSHESELQKKEKQKESSHELGCGYSTKVTVEQKKKIRPNIWDFNAVAYSSS